MTTPVVPPIPTAKKLSMFYQPESLKCSQLYNGNIKNYNILEVIAESPVDIEQFCTLIEVMVPKSSTCDRLG